MKKFRLLFSLVMIVITMQATVMAAECTKSPVYDNSCPSSSTYYGKLRYEQKYFLNDDWYARGGTNELRGFKASVNEQCNYNNSDVEQQTGFFSLTDDIKERNYLMPARTQPYWIITSNLYQVYKKPPQRNDHNMLVKYEVYYNVDGGAKQRHTECKYYAITRCGDGILDTEVGDGETRVPEECDPGPSGTKDLGNGYICNAECKKVKKEVPAPKCGSQYNGVTKYTSGSSTSWLKSSDKLCDEGSGVEFSSIKNEGKPREFTWFCQNSEGKKTSYACTAKQEWCGDGVYNKDYEQCDPNDSKKTNYGTGSYKTCNSECKLVDDNPVCSSTYNNKNIYTSNSSSNIDSYVDKSKLCEIGTMFPSTFSPNQWTPGNPRIHYWGCKNGEKTISEKACKLNQYRCGDGDLNNERNPHSFIDGKSHYETCDPKDPNLNPDRKCENNCDYAKAACGPKSNNNPVYNKNYPNPRIKETDSGLCGTGKIKAGSLSGPDSEGKYTWKCVNGTKDTSCGARDLRCGDGVLQENQGEQCDPADPNHKGWGDGCSAQCEPTYGEAICGSQIDEHTKYQDINEQRLYENTPGLCDKGSVIYFSFDKSTGKYTWQCKNGKKTSKVCTANQEWCGDGKVNETEPNKEKCDPADPNHKGWGDGGCSSRCEPKYNQGKCNSKYNGDNIHTEYLDINESYLTEKTPGLCDVGVVTGFNKHTTSPVYTWQCDNYGKISKQCVADQERCGDGDVQTKNGEICDDGPNNGTKNSSCSKTCQTVSLSCGSKGGSTTYFSTRQTNPWLGNANNEMCPKELSTGIPSIVGNDYHMEWTCSNQNGAKMTCKAYQNYCGDKIVQKDQGEDCDGSDNCNEFCEYNIRPDSSCTQTFEGTLRCGSGYRLEDVYKNNGTIDVWLYDFDVKFEPGYNMGGKPNFVWTKVLEDSNMKVKAGQTMEIIEANPEYVIKNCPEKRSKNNLYMEYMTRTTIKDYNGLTLPNGQLTPHKECINYVITRCGDGEKDEEYGEECDPGSEKTVILSDGRICNADCKVVTPPAPVCNSKYNGHTVDNLTENDDLCSEGTYTIGTFHFNETTNTWTWKCNNVAGVGKDCSATKAVNGIPEIKKTLQNKVEVKEVGQKLNWEVRVTAKGGDIKDFEIWDVMPNELSYLGWDYKDGKPEGLTVTKQDKVGTSGNNKVYYWDVEGTLKEGKSLTIIVKSEVKKMPASGANILNIACVNDDGKVICDPEPVPAVCNSVYSGQTVKELKETDGLCIIGKVTGFKFDESTNKWTWGCNNEESTVSCWAQKSSTPKGTPKIEKTLKNKVIVNAVNQKLTWTVKVTAKGGDIKDFKVRDKLPEVLKYETYRVVKNEDKLKLPEQPSGPVESGSYNIYTWDVTGTLQQGHELIIEIDSIVVKMPTKKDDYRNIACVEDDKVVDCDDAKPGTAEILKVLQNKKEVTETGQELDWKVTVIASGGDIENFEIWDKLPVELDYAGWELDKANTQDKVTVTYDDNRSPKPSGDVNIHYWNVDGVLYSGNKITMIVKSTVKRMPTSGEDILNVACVVQSGNEIDCAEDNPPKPSSKGTPKIEKTLKNKVIVNAVNQKLTWTVEVTAKGGDIKDFKVRDKLPNVLKYNKFRVVKNEDKLKISDKPSGPVESGSYNVYTWDVTGTLYSGHKLIIEIDSTVVKMPTKKDDYRNIACVEDDKVIDCDDAQPGTAKILKELQDKKEVTETGQELDWKVTVIASGGDIENFEIWDKLPVELDFTGWKLDKANTQNGITVTYNSKKSPTKSGDVNIHYWDVDGVLYSGNKITMIVKSTVNRMPRSGEDILNVACVVQSGSEIDCAEDNPPKAGGELVIQKTLNPKKTVTETGEILTWDIKVTASGGAVTGGFKISDIVPNALEFTGLYSIESNEAGLKMEKRYKGSISDLKTREGGEFTGEVWTLDVSGGLEQNQSLILRVTTKVVKMPKNDKEYRNVACVIKDNTQKCDDDQPDQKPKLRITKRIWDGKKEVKSITGHEGDSIEYRIHFGNSGDASVFVSLKDFLPKGLKVESSSVVVYKNNDSYAPNQYNGLGKVVYQGGEKILQGVNINEYTGIFLQPGDSGLMTIKAKPLQSKKENLNRTNFACIYKDGERIDCDDAIYNVEPNEFKCEKLNVPTGNLPNGGGNKEVTCTTSGGVADLITIDCGEGASGNRYITGANKTSLKGTCSYPAGSATYNPICTVKKDGKDYTSDSCKGSVTVEGYSCFPAGTKVIMSDGSKKNIEDVKIGDSILSYNIDTNTNEQSVVRETFVHKDNVHEMYELTINGKVLKVTDIHPFYVRKSVSSKDYAWIEAKDLKIGDILLMNDGRLVKIEKINHYSNVETVYNLEVAGNHDYFVDEGYLVHNKGPTTCFIAGTKVTMADGSQKNIEDVKIGEKVLGSNGTVNTVLGYDRPVLGERHLWSINGSEYFVSDEHPFMTTQGWKSFNPEMTKLEVDLDTTELKVGDILVTNNGFEEIKSVDYINADYYTPLYNFALDGDHTYYANNYLVHNKGCTHDCDPTDYCKDHPDSLECNIANENCFNINVGNFSIEKTELLPLYLNVYRKKDGYNYVFKDEEDSCNPKDVNLASFKCKIRILRPDNNAIAYTSDEFDCLTQGEDAFTSNNKPLIKDRAKEQTDLYDIDPLDSGAGKYRPTIMVTSGDKLKIRNENGEEILGEYKFQIMVTSYDQCSVDSDGNGDGWKTINLGDNASVCQNNFVLTDSYTVQKTPSGNLRASTDTLEKFKYVSGGTVKPFSSYLNAIATSEYHPNQKVNDAMDAFIKKYEKLAVKVDISTSKFLSGTNVKKVPGKHIYFVEGDITVKGGSNNIETPFTIVQTNGSTTISGNVNHNMMLLTKKNIIFSGDCTTGQNVRGIFYASGNLIRQGVKKNDSLSNNVWCTNGGLNIKGVLIGNNFNSLMTKSRSHLETWFIAGDKTKKVMNGASVVIEYSPSIFTKSTMPPGAEDFTTALSIYKN